jgi:ELWxxDGT repeat protein
LASDGVHGREPWTWSASAGVSMLIDLVPSGESIPIDFFDAWLGDHQVTFFSADGPLGRELWRTDGTAAGTQLVADIEPGPGDSYPSRFACDGQRLFFLASTSGLAQELWVSDGTAAGTQLVKDIWPGPIGSVPTSLTSFQGKIFFTASDGTHGRELWSTDGTAAGTQMLLDIHPTSDALPADLLVVGDRLFFSAAEPTHGNERWSTDGTAAGTKLLVEIAPGVSGGGPEQLVMMGGKLYFSATSPGHGRELWTSDGTPAGTHMVLEIAPGSAWSFPSSLTVAGARLFFTARTTATGRELWVTDGSAAGTQLVIDVVPGPTSALDEFEPLLVAGGGVYFAAGSAVSPDDVELTFSDGTAAGTAHVCDLAVGATGSGPYGLHLVDGQLVFVATHPAFGMELFGLASPGAYVQDLGPASAPQRLDATEPHLGAGVQIDVSGLVPSGLGFLLMSGPAAAQSSPLVLSGNASWIDLTSALLIQTFVGPTGSATQPLPANPSLAGLAIDLQVWATTAGLLPLTTSNGLRLVLDV